MNLKTFKKFHKQNKFCWGESDLEHHHTVNEKTTQTQSFPAPIPYHEANVKQFEEHDKSLSPQTVRHIRSYKIDSEGMNKALRTGKTLSKIHHIGARASGPMVEHLDKATNHKLTHHLTVYRGGSGTNAPNSKVMKTVGHEFTDHGYTSTSINHNAAHAFSGSKHIFAIHLKPGDKAHHLDGRHHENNHEGEVLLHRGTKFRVIGHSKHTNYESSKPEHHEDDEGFRIHPESHITHLEVVSQEPREIKTK